MAGVIGHDLASCPSGLPGGWGCVANSSGDLYLVGPSANMTDADLGGADLSGVTLTGVTWSNTVCPNNVNSDTQGGTCP